MHDSKVKIGFFWVLFCLLFCLPSAFAQTAKLEASKAENIGSAYRANSQGVYPVWLRWQADRASGNFEIYRSESADSGFEKTAEEQAIKSENGFFIFVDENPSAVPGKPYYYRVMANNVHFSEIVMGYGALTPEKFFSEYSKTVESSHKKLTLIHKSGNMNKLGSEKIQGALSGSLSYETRVAGLGGRAIMEFVQYADFYISGNRALGSYFILNGNMDTNASLIGNGKMDGTVTVTGMYRGRVQYDKIQIKNALPGAGTYVVEVEGFPQAELSYMTGIK